MTGLGPVKVSALGQRGGSASINTQSALPDPGLPPTDCTDPQGPLTPIPRAGSAGGT